MPAELTMRQWEVLRLVARGILGRVSGEDALKELLPLLRSTEERMSDTVMDALVKMGPWASRDTARELLRMLQDPDEKMWSHALETLKKISPEMAAEHRKERRFMKEPG